MTLRSTNTSDIVSVAKIEQVDGPGYAIQAIGGTNSARPTIFASKQSSSMETIELSQLSAVSTNFFLIARFRYAGASPDYIQIYVSNGTTPHGNLTGRQGDICYNGPSGQPFYCSGGTNWAGM
jgi:hypothetical protein